MNIIFTFSIFQCRNPINFVSRFPGLAVVLGGHLLLHIDRIRLSSIHSHSDSQVRIVSDDLLAPVNCGKRERTLSIVSDVHVLEDYIFPISVLQALRFTCEQTPHNYSLNSQSSRVPYRARIVARIEHEADKLSEKSRTMQRKFVTVRTQITVSAHLLPWVDKPH